MINVFDTNFQQLNQHQLMAQSGEGELFWNTDPLVQSSLNTLTGLVNSGTTSTSESTLYQTANILSSNTQNENLIFDLLDIHLPKEPDSDPLARPNRTLIKLLDGQTTPNSQFTLYQTTNSADFYIWGNNRVFNRTQATYVLTHGWQDYPVNDTKWVDLASSIIQYDPKANIFLTDWSDLATNAVYPESAYDTFVVGQELGNFLERLDIVPSKTTLIGHSLGAHVSGIAADRYDSLLGNPSIKTVIGLDPAGPSFEDDLVGDVQLLLGGRDLRKKVYRLDASDATQVVALHTDLILGYDARLADLDIYVNEPALVQPGELSFVGNHLYAVNLAADLYKGAAYVQNDGSVFELNDLFTSTGSYAVETTAV
ncbi:hypothetical protein C7H19_22925 [Aphanothece hegewaldii CCALA 016]|uniref:Lipase domain-containing protein n=1 Tax=Aphanothece hegewaldii CCALA 016 TaxID=2107694 RepID=A0A2T1LRF8_9CHRO|nr:hypothetical protein [Aphanothece hegewaldii]PSF31296.1 hypothetical protein C7H19_22925 [Aphanothece hegewaldii CCALA 016]